MTPEQPPISLRHPRPGPAGRRKALGLSGPPVGVRESLRDSLARIPDLHDEVPTNPIIKAALAVGASPAADAGAPVGPLLERTAEARRAPALPEAAAAVPAGPEVDEPVAPSPAPDASPDPDAVVLAPAVAGAGSDGPAVGDQLIGRAGRTPPMWRRVLFAIVLIGLVASIPILGLAGSRIIANSTDGNATKDALSPSQPGYEAQVDPTPTAVAIQFDDEGRPDGVTFLTLTGTGKGGAVVFVPLDTEVTEPSYGVDKLRTAYKVVADRPALARERLASQVGRLLNVGIGETIDLDASGWAQLIAPVAPLQIDNPDAVTLADGTVVPAGTTELTAEEVGPYLAASNPDESDLNRLNRHEVLWDAWLKKLASTGTADKLPGESAAGMGRFAREFAQGNVSFDTLPVTSIAGLAPLFRADKSAVGELITNTVASPTPAAPGSRFTVRLLNGVAADAIPADLVRQIVSRGGAVTVLGNGPSFGTSATTVVYANPVNKDRAILVAKSIGATGKVRLDREAPDTVDLTIVLGKDILGNASGIGEAGGTAPDTTNSSGGD